MIRRAESVADCLSILNVMIEEAQEEANEASNHLDMRELIAKRNALTEAKMRVRDGARDHGWTRCTFFTTLPRH